VPDDSRRTWIPGPADVASANSTRFRRAHAIGDYPELVRRSSEEPEWFWDAVVRHLPVEFSTPYEQVLDLSDGPEWARWFVGGRLNLTWNCVDRHVAAGRGAVDAIRFEREDGAGGALTYAEVAAEVSRLADGLASLGIGQGDRVALVMPMTPEAVIAFYAVAKLGAVVVLVFSGFSSAALAVRLQDSEAVCVVTADAYTRRGRRVPVKATVDDAVAASPSVRHVVVHRFAGGETTWSDGRDLWWHDVVARRSTDRPAREVDSEHPVVIAYTSGTTGLPKGAVHVHGGFLVKLATEVHFQANLREGDVAAWISDMGWIQGPWMMVGAHALGTTLALFDGAPDYPDAGRLWRFVERHEVAFLGLSPTLLRALMAADGAPPAEEELATLRAFGCAGEPLDPASYRWLFDTVGRARRPIINLSGGTEVAASFLTCDVSIPHKESSLGLPALGMAVDVFGSDGKSLRGEVGELICRRPWPAMTRGIWGDPDRYLETYWRRFPNVWTHGDWASIDAEGYWFLHGRSDDTLNIAGKRIGPAEFEAAAVQHPVVVEAAAIGMPHDVKGEVAWLFCVPSPGGNPDAAEVADQVAQALGKGFRPARVIFVAGLPKTRSAKIVRRAVRATALGTDPGDLSALENPETLAEIARAAREGA
jgi:acetyl-CoA synthetase